MSIIGTNRRYAHRYDQMMSDRILEDAVQGLSLQTLTDAELRLDFYPVTITPRPEKVRAWVRFGPKPFQVDATVERWTPDAVGIRFVVREKEYRCWVWAGAVTRKEPPSPGV